MARKQIVPILIVFILANAILLFSNAYFIEATTVKFRFIMAVNVMLFALSIFNFNRIRKVDLSNPRAMVNSVMIGTILKMVVFAGAALIYATQKLPPVGMPTLLLSMTLYLIYTWLEIRWTQGKY